MQAGLPADAPLGYYSFCVRFPDQCPADTKPAPPVEAAAVWPLLTRVNAQVNAAIAPELDADHYGIAEYWTIPTDGVGDCKSYTLTKRKVLHDVGIPFSDLRVAVVKLWDDELHAVLVVSTDRGDYVLDNLRPDVRPWTDAGYSWIEATSRTNSQWASLQNRSQETVASTVAATGSVISALPTRGIKE
jgi:predicted transglutaminase-like cysteine proteinase